jgi:hypothetical protein
MLEVDETLSLFPRALSISYTPRSSTPMTDFADLERTLPLSGHARFDHSEQNELAATEDQAPWICPYLDSYLYRPLLSLSRLAFYRELLCLLGVGYLPGASVLPLSSLFSR